MRKSSVRKVVVPMVTSAMAQPFVADALRKDIPLDGLLAVTGLGLKDIQSGEMLMPGQKWYDLMQNIADASEDPEMGFRIGSQAAIDSLPNLRNLKTRDATLGNLLTSMVIEAESLTSLADYQLTVKSRVAELSSLRTFKPTSRPSQADGYFAGFLQRLLKLCCGTVWEPQAFEMNICDKSAVPVSVRENSAVRRTSTTGVNFKFPSKWLLLANHGEAKQNPVEGDVRQTRFMDSISLILELHLADPNLTLDRLSALASCSRSELKRQFQKHETSFQKELDLRRSLKAQRLLVETDLPVAEVGTQVGFSDPPGFSRAFKRWTGSTPGRFRISD